jgi:pimeloyl-ACP methyl ester carboxylesterase
LHFTIYNYARPAFPLIIDAFIPTPSPDEAKMHSDSISSDSLPKSKFEDIDHARISYLDYEGSSKRPLIFLHATGFLPWLWHPIAKKLTSSFHSFAPYFCDHRHADPQTGGMHWSVLAEDFAALCRRLAVTDGYFVGHSMGATVLTIAAALYGLSPKAMILIEPIYLPADLYKRPMTIEEHPLASKAVKRRNAWHDEEEARQYLKSRDLFRQWDDEALDLYIRYGLREQGNGGLELTCSPQREAALFMGGVHYDPWPLLPLIQCPILVVEGQMSDNKRMIDLQKATAQIPNGTYMLVENVGHLIPMENPEAVTRIILDYFT